MKLRKKLAVSTLAASLVAGSWAGVPLSSKGLAEKMGFSNVVYAAGLEAPTLKNKLQAIHSLLDANGLSAIDNLQQAISAVNYSDLALIYPITDKLGFTDHTNDVADIKLIFDLFKAAATATYDPNLTTLETLRLDPNLRTLLGTVDTTNKLTVPSIETFILAIEQQAWITLNGMDWSARLNLAANSDSSNAARKTFMTNILSDVMNANTASGVGGFLHDKAITAATITNTLFALQQVIDAKGQAQSHPNVSRNAFFRLAMAYYIYKNIITTPPVTPPSPPVTPPSPPVTPPVTPSNILVPPSVDQVTKDLDAILLQLQGASAAEKAKLLEQALKLAQQALDAASIDLSKSLTFNGDKAIGRLDVNLVKKQIADLKKTADDLKAKLKQMGLDSARLTLSLKFDLGQTGTAAGELTIPKDILAEAQNAGFDNAVIVVNGVTVSLPISEFHDDTTITVRKVGTPPKTDNIQVSDVIDFSLSVGGQPVTNFKQPIKIRIPIQTPAGVDKELLTTAKIVDGKLVFVGGHLEGNEMVESRDTLSPYVVVENKVTFNDIDSVKSWAGRPIQVLAAKGAIVGNSEGVFAPQDSVTRAEFVKMLISGLDLEDGTATESFADVNESDWFAPYVAAAVKLGIVHGRSVDQFVPNATITRAEMTAMIVHALEATKNLKNDVSDPNAALKVFSDASKINSSLKAAVALAASKGLVTGYAGKFDPNGNATRAQAAVVLYHMLNYSNQ